MSFLSTISWITWQPMEEPKTIITGLPTANTTRMNWVARLPGHTSMTGFVVTMSLQALPMTEALIQVCSNGIH